MTLQLETDDKIAGLPILEVRDLLRKLSEGFRPGSLERVGYSRHRATKLIRALTLMGYVEVAPDGYLKLTSQCRTFIRGSAARRIKRETADVALDEFMDRVEKANNNEEFLMKITAVIVFGSYLRTAERLGDLDLAIELEPKKTTDDLTARHRMYADHFERSGRAYRYVGYEYDWAEQEVFLFLKSRKRTLNLHPIHDFVAMKKAPDFCYKVLVGDPEHINAKLRA